MPYFESFPEIQIQVPCDVCKELIYVPGEPEIAWVCGDCNLETETSSGYDFKGDDVCP